MLWTCAARELALDSSSRRVPLATPRTTREVKAIKFCSREASARKNMKSQTLLVALCLSTAAALQLSRRDLARAIGIGAATLAPVANAADIKSCPKGANNCWSTASTDKTALKPWTYPGKKADAVKQLRAALEAYPQAGAGQR